jgi:hypothetical protein
MVRTKLFTEAHTLSYPRGLISPEDLMNFVLLPQFRRQWDSLELTDLDFEALRILIMIEPKRGPVMKGTGSLRKVRFSPPGWNIGKSGALRIGYSYSETRSTVLLVTAFSKHDKANLSPRERAIVKSLLREAWARV